MTAALGAEGDFIKNCNDFPKIKGHGVGNTKGKGCTKVNGGAMEQAQ